MANWRPLAVLCCALLPVLPAGAARVEPIRISTSELPPFSMEAAAEGPGALREMVAELLRRTHVPASMEFVPWQRAIYLSTSQGRSAIFPLSRSPEREHQYRWLARLYHEQFLFMALKGGRFDVRQPALGKQRRIGILRGALTVKELKADGYKHIVEASSVDENLRFLRRGIVDAVFGERAIYRAWLRAHNEGEYVMSEAQRTSATWLGGSLDFSDADAALFQKAMKDMVDDGSYAQILKKYDLPPGP